MDDPRPRDYARDLFLFLFCNEIDLFKMSLSDDTQADIIEVYNSTSKYLNVLLINDSPYFE